MAEMELKNLNEREQHCGNDDEPQQKRPNPDECENDADAVEAKTITNIYYDCLERIFDFLDIGSLLMVANTCKRLQIAAAAKFGDQSGNKRVLLDLVGVNRPSVHLYDSNGITVTHLKFCLPFLRCFGRKITKLTAYFSFERSKDEYLDRYINQYCAETLTDISIRFKSKFAKESFEKPFKNVERFEIMGCHLSGESFQNVANWLPNVRHLESMYCAIEATASMNVHFPHLEHLKLCMEDNDSDNERNESAMDILESNPQLQSLQIASDFGLTFDTLLTKIHGNKSITTLNVSFGETDVPDVNANELKRFVAEHSLVVELIFKSYRLTADDAINSIHQMKSLKQIGFQVRCRAECDRIIKEFEGEWKSEVSTDDGKFYIKLSR